MDNYAQINLKNLQDNFLSFSQKVEDRKIMLAVKADAYGHGMIECVRALNELERSPDYYLAAFIEEAEKLAAENIKQDILVLEPVSENNFKKFSHSKIIPTVFCEEHLRLLEKLDRQIKVHIKIDTGMNDFGIDVNDAFAYISQISKNKNFIIDGVYTHFATSVDRDKSFTNLQFSKFKEILKKLRESKINYGLAHCANSGALLDMEETYMDMVRPGVSLYGYYPSDEVSREMELKPVMSIHSSVANVRRVRAGETVSYGRTFKTEQDTRVAIISFGYADGFRRALSNKARVLINGKSYNQVGTVQMDKIAVEVGDDDVSIGDEVVLLGRSGEEEIGIEEWAEKIDTIVYEVTCGISKRVPRVYVK